MDVFDRDSLGTTTTAPAPAPFEISAASTTEIPEADLNQIMTQYCVVCHNPPMVQAAGLGSPPVHFEGFDVTKPEMHAELAEKMVKKLRAGMMPPPLMPRPGGDTLLVLVETLEKNLDKAAARNPNPELLGIEVDAGRWLPLDVMSANFDNVAEVQGLSPLVLESYMNAAGEISRMALGDRNAATIKHTYTNSDYVSLRPTERAAASSSTTSSRSTATTSSR
jgi:hypothetical protein